MLRKFGRRQADLFHDANFLQFAVMERDLLADFNPVMRAHFRRVFLSVFDFHNQITDLAQKQDVSIFGRNVDLERMVSDYFAQRAFVFSGVSARISQQIITVIARGRDDNLTVPQIAKAIQSRVDGIAPARAALISRTETHSAATRASHLYYGNVRDSLGMSMFKTWTAANDLRTRKEHRGVSGTTIPMDEKFILPTPRIGPVKIDHPGDPSAPAYHVVNCRCVVIYSDELDLVE